MCERDYTFLSTEFRLVGSLLSLSQPGLPKPWYPRGRRRPARSYLTCRRCGEELSGSLCYCLRLYFRLLSIFHMLRWKFWSYLPAQDKQANITDEAGCLVTLLPSITDQKASTLWIR
jgi:hypothetical protein